MDAAVGASPSVASASAATLAPSLSSTAAQTDAVAGDGDASGGGDGDGDGPADGGGAAADAAARAARCDRDSVFVASLRTAASAAAVALIDNEAADVGTRPLGRRTGAVARRGGGSTLRAAGGLAPPAAASALPTTSLAWAPDAASTGRLAVSHAPEALAGGGGGCVVLWDSAAARPASTTLLPTGAASLTPAPRDASLLAAALDDGGVALLDARLPGGVAQRSAPGAGHAAPATDLAWPPARAPADWASVGADGTILWWDGRELGRGPADRERLRGRGRGGAPPAGRAVAATAAGTSRLLVSTDHGTVLPVARGARPPADRVGAPHAGARAGPLSTLTPHPVLPRFFLTAGDGGAAVWSKDARWPLQPPGGGMAARSFAARWLPSRPAAFLDLSPDGTLTARDVRAAPGDVPPSLRVGRGAAATALRVVAPAAAGGPCPPLAAASFSDGRVDLVRWTGDLAEGEDGGERAAAAALLEREAERERAADQAARDARGGARRRGGAATHRADLTARAEAEAVAAEAALLAAVGGSVV